MTGGVNYSYDNISTYLCSYSNIGKMALLSDDKLNNNNGNTKGNLLPKINTRGMPKENMINLPAMVSLKAPTPVKLTTKFMDYNRKKVDFRTS